MTTDNQSEEPLRTALREAVRLTPSSSRGRDTRPYADRLFDRLRTARAATLSGRRKQAADLCVETARQLKELGFGCEIIATWEAASGERVAAHITTPNPWRSNGPAGGYPR